jgi:hypothetical protein
VSPLWRIANTARLLDEKISPAQKNSPQAHIADSSPRKSRQLFIHTHNEPLSVVAMPISKEKSRHL